MDAQDVSDEYRGSQTFFDQFALPSGMPETSLADPAWRQTHLGRLLGHALRRFDERVLELMARNIDVPLALSNLAARAQVSAAHVHITRHLAPEGSRLTDLAAQAGMSKQAMGDLVDQCEAWGLVTREADTRDRRAHRAAVARSLSPGAGAGRSRVPPGGGGRGGHGGHPGAGGLCRRRLRQPRPC
jgi:hypothetical protein